MTELLNELREKAILRAGQLERDIQDAKDLIAMYESELAPFREVIKATSPSPTEPRVPPTGTSEALATAVGVAIQARTRPDGQVRTYSTSTPLPETPTAPVAAAPATPKFRRASPRIRILAMDVVDNFGHITRPVTFTEVFDWVTKMASSPNTGSAMDTTYRVMRHLVAEGIATKVGGGRGPLQGTGMWTFTKATTPTAPTETTAAPQASIRRKASDPVTFKLSPRMQSFLATFGKFRTVHLTEVQKWYKGTTDMSEQTAQVSACRILLSLRKRGYVRKVKPGLYAIKHPQ